MSKEGRDWAKVQTTGDRTLKAVLNMLGDLAGPKGFVYHGQATIAAIMECDKRTIRRSLQALEDMGLIRREERRRKDGSRSTDHIILAMEAPEPEGQPDPTGGQADPRVGSGCPEGGDTVSPLTSFDSGFESGIESFSGPDGPAPEKDAGPRDFRKDLFERGTRTLRSLTGRSAVKCRALIGKWLKLVDDDAATVMATIDAAEEGELAEPVSWIEAQLRAAGARMRVGRQLTRPGYRPRPSSNGALSLLADMMGLPDDLTARRVPPPSGAAPPPGPLAEPIDREAEPLRMVEEGLWPRGGAVFVAAGSPEGAAWEAHFARFGQRARWTPFREGLGWFMPCAWPPDAPALTEAPS